jgi:hypothetical protein
MKLISIALASVLLSGCLAKDKDPILVCEEFIDKKIMMETVLDTAARHSQTYAELATLHQSVSADCAYNPQTSCLRGQKYLRLSRSHFENRLTLVGVAVSGSRSQDGSYACRAVLQLSLGNGNVTSNEISWRLDTTKSGQVSSENRIRFSQDTLAWIEALMYGENVYSSSLKNIDFNASMSSNYEATARAMLKIFDDRVQVLVDATGIDYPQIIRSKLRPVEIDYR